MEVIATKNPDKMKEELIKHLNSLNHSFQALLSMSFRFEI